MTNPNKSHSQILLWSVFIIAAGLIAFFLIRQINRESRKLVDIDLMFSQAQKEDALNARLLEELNTEVLLLHGQLRAPAGDKSRLRAQTKDVLKRRADKLITLIQSSPQSAFSLAFPEAILRELHEEVPGAENFLESRGQWSGPAEVLIGDLTNGSKTSLVTIKHNGQVLNVNLAFPEPAGLKCGSILTVRGILLSSFIAAADGSISQSEIASATCAPTGEQNIVVILANLKNYQLSSGVDAELVKGTFLGNAYSTKQNTPDWNLDGFWKENSVNVTRVKNDGSPGSLTVVGPFNLSKNYNTKGSCDSLGIRNDAIAAADPTVNFNNFNRILIVHPANGACSYAGQAYIGCVSQTTQDGTVTTGIAWQRSDHMTSRNQAVQLTTHEFGHSLGLHHASSRDFGSEAIGSLNTQGSLNEYGDTHSTMGSWNHGLYSSQHIAELLNWMPEGTDYEQVESGGSYTLRAYETQAHVTKGLKVRRGAGNDAWLWLDFRTNTGLYDSTLNSQIWSGALIHYQDLYTGSYTHLVDFTTTTNSFTDAALAVGQTWSDPYSNLNLTVNSIVGDTLYLTIYYGVLPCTASNPTVTITPDSASTSEGVGANFNVSIKNNDTQACAPKTFDIASTMPNTPWLTGFSSQALNLAPSETGSVTMTKTPPAGSIGSHTVNATAANGSSSAADTATLYVTAPLTASLTTNKTAYARGEKVIMTAAVTNGTPISGAIVSFSLTKSNGSITTKTATTNSSGVAVWTYSSKRNDPTGTWTANAIAAYGSQSAAAPPKTFLMNP